MMRVQAYSARAEAEEAKGDFISALKDYQAMTKNSPHISAFWRDKIKHVEEEALRQNQ